jgi:hypothetical protein
VRLIDESACEHHSLALSARQKNSTLAYHGFEPERHFLNAIVNVRLLSRPLNF